MSQLIASGASIVCTFGTAPSTLTATSTPLVHVDGKPAATLADGAPMINIKPFGMCTSLANPQVAAATAAALGVLTPQPCIPSTGAWLPSGCMVLAQGLPCLTQESKCMCMYAGQISVVNPGQLLVSAT